MLDRTIKGKEKMKEEHQRKAERAKGTDAELLVVYS